MLCTKLSQLGAENTIGLTQDAGDQALGHETALVRRIRLDSDIDLAQNTGAHLIHVAVNHIDQARNIFFQNTDTAALQFAGQFIHIKIHVEGLGLVAVLLIINSSLNNTLRIGRFSLLREFYINKYTGAPTIIVISNIKRHFFDQIAIFQEIHLGMFIGELGGLGAVNAIGLTQNIGNHRLGHKQTTIKQIRIRLNVDFPQSAAAHCNHIGIHVKCQFLIKRLFIRTYYKHACAAQQ